MAWLHGRGKPWPFDGTFRRDVGANIDGVVKRAETMACKLEREQVRVSVRMHDINLITAIQGIEQPDESRPSPSYSYSYAHDLTSLRSPSTHEDV
jgi:hypothetical protein